MHRITVLLGTLAITVGLLSGNAYASSSDGSSLTSQLPAPPATETAPPHAGLEAQAGPDSQAATADQGTSVPLTVKRAANAPAAQAMPAAVSPAGCVASIDDAHVASSVPGAVKVNARITCRNRVQALALEVNLYKTVFFGLFASLQASTTTYNAGQSSLQNQGTFRRCTNTKSTDWFGTAFALSEENGTLYEAQVRSPHTRTINCGT